MLTNENAIAYLTERQPCAIVSASLGRMDGLAVVQIEFTYSDGQAGQAHVWTEGGTLYGEW